MSSAAAPHSTAATEAALVLHALPAATAPIASACDVAVPPAGDRQRQLGDLLAAFALLLWRYSDQADLRFALQASDGTRAAHWLLPMSIGADDTLGTIRAAAAAAIETSAGLTAFAGDARSRWSLAIAPRETLSLELGGAVGTCRVRSDDGAVSPPRLRALAAHLGMLLAAPDAACAATAPLLTPAEFERVVHAWNSTDTSLPALSLAALWQQQVRQTPAAIAIDHGAQQLDYAALDAEAERLAHRLRDAGIAPEQVVGVCSERSIALVVALLAIVKCGAIYAAFDPALPTARLRAMAEAAQPVVMLVAGTSAESAWIGSARTIEIASGFAPQDASVSPLPLPALARDSLAYVIFTSGSTGAPKAVAGTGRGLVNRLLWMQQRFPCGPGEVIAQKTAITFIDALTETLGCLLFGGRLSIVDAADATDPARLWQRLVATRAQRLVLVPALLSVLLDHAPPPDAHALRLVVCSGEALPGALAQSARQRLPQTQLVNLYGSSEVAGDVTFHCIDAAAAAQTIVPLGRPIANTQCYVLDARREPVPVGVAGELWLGGANIAAGYLGAPGLSAEKFLPDPFRPGGRLFRSGDRVRFDDDGAIEFLGRMDRQVKLRGVRVELGDVEAAFVALSGVAAAAVVFDADAGVALAYVQTSAGAPPRRAADWRSELRRLLPDAMLPAQVIEMTALPYTSSGKLDRKALPRPDGRRGDGGYVAPRTALETELAALWAARLGLDRIGIHDDFFDLGGYSLLAMRLVEPLSALIGRTVSLHDIVAAPTIAGFAAAQGCGGDAPARPPSRLRWD